MKLVSSAFKNKEEIPELYTCEGADISPPLEIIDIPKKAKSVVLIMDDHDVPPEISPKGVWDHWIIFNVRPEITKIPEGRSPRGVKGKNSWGMLGYGGPCPPDKLHNYSFRVYALDGVLDLEEGATKLEVLRLMEGHVLANAELIGTYIKKENR